MGTVGARLFRPLPELRARQVRGAKEALIRREEEALGSLEEYAMYVERPVRIMKGAIIAGGRTRPQWRMDKSCTDLQ